MPKEIGPLAAAPRQAADTADTKPSDQRDAPLKHSPSPAWPDRRFDALSPRPGRPVLPPPPAPAKYFIAEGIRNVARHTDTDKETLDLAAVSRWYQAALHQERRGILLTGIAADTSAAAPPPLDILEGKVSLHVLPDGTALKEPLVLSGIASLPLSMSSEPLQRLLENPRLDDPAVFEKIFNQALDKAPRMTRAERQPLLAELARHIDDLAPGRQSHYFFEILAVVQKDLDDTWPLTELIDQIRHLPDRHFEAFSGCLAMVKRLDRQRLSYNVEQLIHLLPDLGEQVIDGMKALLAPAQPHEGTAPPEHTSLHEQTPPAPTTLEDRRFYQYDLARACLRQTRYALPRCHAEIVSLLMTYTKDSDLGEDAEGLMSKIGLELRHLSLTPNEEDRFKAALRPYMPPGF